MRPMFRLTSGDPAADRRVDFALMLFADGDPSAAAETMLSALEIVSDWPLGWYQLGEFHEAAGDMDAAVTAWRTALRLDPEDHAGASLKLALAGAAELETPPSAFAEALFDQYADKFDKALVDGLGYRVPELLEAALRATGRETFALALDLGCGTGLMGERLRPLCARLEGFDISSEMLRQARAKSIYDRLDKADLQHFVHGGPAADLVTAADVFMYLGALDQIFATVSSVLAPSGLFAFSVEDLEADSGFALQPSRRYAHSEACIRQLLAENRLDLLSLQKERIRDDRHDPVRGLIVVASRN